MKFFSTLFATATQRREMKQNLRALAKVLALLVAVILIFAVGFHVIMAWEGQQFSWFTGVYWALTVMSTLGFGDITFESDLGRMFSTLVLVVGMVLMLIVFPFAFIRFFYAPWIEAGLRMRAPRAVDPRMTDHIILTSWDAIAEGLAQRLETRGTPFVVIEPDPARASELHADHVSVIYGELDDRLTYERVGADRARLLVTNRDDVTNTVVTLTAREVAPNTPIAAVATALNSIDVMELAGANHVLPLKQRLGEQLAKRMDAGHTEAHVIGRIKDLLIAEFSAYNTPFAGKTIEEVDLQGQTGAAIVGSWERARMVPATPKTRLTRHSVPVVVGTQEMIDLINRRLRFTNRNSNPVLVIGAGKVGRAATRALKERGAGVNVVDLNPERELKLAGVPDRFIVGDAADLAVLEEAGVREAPSVLITTNVDAQNVFLTVYCRRLRPDALIVSRVTHQRNMESMHRAGADLALSYGTLGVESVLSVALDRDSVILGEGMQLLDLPTPPAMVGRRLGQVEIEGSGVTVVAVLGPDGLRIAPPPDQVLEAGSELALIGNQKRLEEFALRCKKPTGRDAKSDRDTKYHLT